MKIINFGSINIDLVYRVPHIVRDGETLASTGFATFAGGKGANQSVALGRAGATVLHAGRVGHDGQWLLDRLTSAGVDTSLIAIDPSNPTGHAIIQVDDQGQNAIVLFAGANHRVTPEQVAATLRHAQPGDCLLLQHELNDVPALITAGHAAGLSVCFNPAPFGPAVRDYPLDLVDTLIVNETEAADLEGKAGDPLDDALAARAARGQTVILTRGADGATCWTHDERIDVPSPRVQAIDTTAAGDTFIGYLLAARAQGQAWRPTLERACKAASICVTRAGALDSIPTAAQVDAG